MTMFSYRSMLNQDQSRQQGASVPPAANSEVVQELNELKRHLDTTESNLTSLERRLAVVKRPGSPGGPVSPPTAPDEILSPLGDAVRSLRRHAQRLANLSDQLEQDLGI